MANHTRGEIPVPRLINWLSVGALPVLVFFAFRAADRGDSLVMATLTIVGVLLLLNGLVYLILRQETLHRRTFIIIIAALFIYVATAALEDGSAIIWLFAYPPIIFYISTLRVGVLTCAFGLTALIGLFSPLGDRLFGTPYSDSFRLMMINVLAFEMISCYILDLSRRRSKASLLTLAGEYEYAAKHDTMTGLTNRREGLIRLEGEYQRYLRNGKPFSVILLDIDLFKGVNDNYGHQTGDKLIIKVADKLKDGCRRIDIVSRWGGEEFLAILPETGINEAMRIAERIRQTIAASPVTFDGQVIRATISAGVAGIHGVEPPSRLLQRADEALYTAKASGRNRVCSGEIPSQDTA
ncbi:GGDEF domain-containing protein [Marinobacter halodurans]|uniref:GGDEF domain-containing protein n=1 Tax=Marinobacter halodurans TaxID=2528979 RepID=UPI001F60A63F|nr:GGDEF domain-containing protein [Marinobacter halodurans]